MRVEQLTFTRFLAAVSIVVYHYDVKSFLFNNDYVSFVFRNADVGVSYFFILSGFVMMIAHGNCTEISPVKYFRNRFVRIYPLYFIALLLTLLGQILTKDVNILGLVLCIFMVQSWIPSRDLLFNPPSWTLSIEFVFYAIFPFVFNRLFKNVGLKKLSTIIILFWVFSQIVSQIFFSLNHLEFLGIPIMHINQFLIGTLAGFLFIEKRQFKKGNYDILIIIVFVLLLLALKFQIGLNYHNGLLAVLFVPLILFISLNDGFITKFFQKKAFVFLGEISYGIYILQHPVYSLISAYSVNKYLNLTDPTIVFFIRLVILITFSSILYIYVEKPLLNRVKSRDKAVFSLNSI